MSQRTTPPQLSKTPQSTQPQSIECRPSVDEIAPILNDRLNHDLTDATHPMDNMIVIEALGFKASEIRAMLIAGNLSIRAEKQDLKGKGKENEGFSQGPSKIRRHLEVDIELPIGVQAEDIEAVLRAGVLTIQLPSPSARCTRIVVEDLDDHEGDMNEE